MPNEYLDDEEDPESLIQAPVSVREAIASRLASRGKDLKSAQQQASQGRMNAGITEGIGQMIHGMSHSDRPFDSGSYDYLRENANAPVKDVLQRQQSNTQGLADIGTENKITENQEGLDPNSTRSKVVHGILSRYNPGLANTPIAATDAKLVEGLEKTKEMTETRKEIAKGNSATKTLADQAKADAELAQKRTQLGSRGGNAKYVDALRRVQNMDDLLARYPDLDTMPGEQVRLLFSELDGMVNGGAPTQAGTHGITADSIKSKMNDLLSKWTNRPQGAELGAYLKQVQPYVADVGGSARKHLLGEHSTLIDGYKGRLSQDAYARHKQEVQSSFGAPTPPQAPKLSPEDQQAVDWAKANPTDPRAAQIMKLHPGM